MFTAIREMSVQAELELCYFVDRSRFSRVSMWIEPVGVTQPEQPILLEKRYPDGRQLLVELEPRPFQLSFAFIASRN